jgi:hypothetical protein
VPNAITDEIVTMVAELDGLKFLDISFANRVTDAGMHAFNEKVYPVTKLFVNGMTSITAIGLHEVILSCRATLKILEASLMS